MKIILWAIVIWLLLGLRSEYLYGAFTPESLFVQLVASAIAGLVIGVVVFLLWSIAKLIYISLVG